jgi:adenylyltransferase/sulfurtransferase
MLGERERDRYHRQILLDEIGEAGQERLKRAKVLVAGVGGLGSAASCYLACAGVGHLRIVDCDKVSLSDLNRQVLYSTADIGRTKVEVAKGRLQSLNPEIQVEAVDQKVTDKNTVELSGSYDLIVDGMDSLSARYMLNKAAIKNSIPLFHGAVYGFEGRVTTVIPGETPCLRCIYDETLPVTEMPVVGATPAVIGCIQATEVMKYIVDKGNLLTGRLLIYDGLSSRFREVTIERNPDCVDCSSIARHERG